MKSIPVVALIVALPVEIANFGLAGFPFEGFPANTDWYIKVIAYQWLDLHFPGLMLAFRLEGTRLEKIGIPLLFASGYLDTALLITAGLFAFRWWAGRSRQTESQLS